MTDICCIGHITLDKIITPTLTANLNGGTSFYFSYSISKMPNVSDRLALAVAQAVHDLRENDNIMKKPSIAETLDWIAALEALGAPDLTPEAAGLTAGFILKNEEDIAQLDTGCGCGEHEASGHHCGHHHH